MGWMAQLLKTYEIVSQQGAFDDAEQPLVEAGFIAKRVDVMVTLDADGAFREAERLEKGKDDTIIIPTTPEAESRTSSKLPPYPLFDQLLYLAGDGYQGEDAKYFDSYLEALTDWANEPDAPEALTIYQRYIARKCLVKDLQASGFKLDPDKDSKLFLCFRILLNDADSERLWQRRDIRDSWYRRSVAQRGNAQLCYVEGKVTPILDSHPKLLGNGKLISSQDTGTIFQYKGRFTQPDEAVMVSYDASIKAHNTLLWRSSGRASTATVCRQWLGRRAAAAWSFRFGMTARRRKRRLRRRYRRPIRSLAC